MSLFSFTSKLLNSEQRLQVHRLLHLETSYWSLIFFEALGKLVWPSSAKNFVFLIDFDYEPESLKLGLNFLRFDGFESPLILKHLLRRIACGHTDLRLAILASVRYHCQCRWFDMICVLMSSAFSRPPIWLPTSPQLGFIPLVLVRLPLWGGSSDIWHSGFIYALYETWVQ